jgi:hypothetical protein
MNVFINKSLDDDNVDYYHPVLDNFFILLEKTQHCKVSINIKFEKCGSLFIHCKKCNFFAYICLYCNKTFKKKQSLKKHFQIKHIPIEGFSCLFCGDKIMGTELILLHLNNHAKLFKFKKKFSYLEDKSKNFIFINIK